LKNNFTVTTSGIFYQPALICTSLALGTDLITFAVDYPYEDTEEAPHFMREAPFAESDKEKIYHGNTDRLFRI
jgi:predicted TIM-barrel fold metal-dependent hydrolase